jgi:hypothetical protein
MRALTVGIQKYRDAYRTDDWHKPNYESLCNPLVWLEVRSSGQKKCDNRVHQNNSHYEPDDQNVHVYSCPNG